LFTTKTGEISIKLDSFVILAKALRPPPEKWHGLADTEIRYRQRYLDLMSNPDVKDVMLKRSEIIREIRNFLHARGFVEVETPMMQAIPGGAAAQPFKTHHNALGCDFYLRIALELYLKRLLVGGVDKVFEIGRNFRNEGLSRKHNPEFTMLEAYQAFGDYESMMELVQGMVCHVAQKVLGTLKIKHERKETFSSVLEAMLNRMVSFFGLIQELGYKRSTQPIPRELHELRIKFDVIQERAKTEPVQEIAREAEKVLNDFLSTAISWATIASGFDEHLQANSKLIKKEAESFKNALKASLPPFLTDKTIDLTPPWKRAKYKDLVREKAGADWFEVSPEVRRQRAHDLGAEITKDYQDFEVTGAVFEKLIEPTLIQPTFVTHLPKELVPLAKLSPDDPTTVEVFECCINGQEIAPAYSEQNDPIEQRERLEHQAGGEQQKLDEDFLIALEHGMPPAGGMGMGIDRLCMMLLGQESIRDVILFPQLKPK
jgi:lysyl-tRNA synthetase class 2